MSRNRLTDQTIANIKAAEQAQLVKVPHGWQVELSKETKSIPLADKVSRPVVYSSKEAARRALGRYNPALEVSLKPEF